MARPQVADGGEGLQTWRVAANTLNKQSRTADKGWSSSLDVRRGANHKKVTVCYKIKHRLSKLVLQGMVKIRCQSVTFELSCLFLACI